MCVYLCVCVCPPKSICGYVFACHQCADNIKNQVIKPTAPSMRRLSPTASKGGLVTGISHSLVYQNKPISGRSRVSRHCGHFTCSCPCRYAYTAFPFSLQS